MASQDVTNLENVFVPLFTAVGTALSNLTNARAALATQMVTSFGVSQASATFLSQALTPSSGAADLKAIMDTTAALALK